jgi:hypothetical protein
VKPAYLDCLRSNRAIFVLTDQARMPTPLDLFEEFNVVTGPFAYVRLLGGRKAVDDLTPTLDKIVIDRNSQLANDAKAIKVLSKQVPVSLGSLVNIGYGSWVMSFSAERNVVDTGLRAAIMAWFGRPPFVSRGDKDPARTAP